jgi:thiamine biosynthesis lipoprotein
MCQEHTLTRLRPALGTLVAIEARSPETATASRALEAGFAAVHGVEHRLHPTRAGSELARLNRASPGTRLRVCGSTVAILRLSRRLAVASGGWFEPALPGQGSILDWLPDGRDAIVIRRRAHVDLGGIAKGFAVDLAVEAMRRAGASAGLVNAGGDLRVYGQASWTGWLRSADGTARELVLREGALAVSEAVSGHRPPEHRGYCAGRGSPGRGYPGGSDGRAHGGCCAVVARCAALADGLTKVVMHASLARTATILAQFRASAIARGNAIVVST